MPGTFSRSAIDAAVASLCSAIAISSRSAVVLGRGRPLGAEFADFVCPAGSPVGPADFPPWRIVSSERSMLISIPLRVRGILDATRRTLAAPPCPWLSCLRAPQDEPRAAEASSPALTGTIGMCGAR